MLIVMFSTPQFWQGWIGEQGKASPDPETSVKQSYSNDWIVRDMMTCLLGTSRIDWEKHKSQNSLSC